LFCRHNLQILYELYPVHLIILIRNFLRKNRYLRQILAETEQIKDKLNENYIINMQIRRKILEISSIFKENETKICIMSMIGTIILLLNLQLGPAISNFILPIYVITLTALIVIWTASGIDLIYSKEGEEAYGITFLLVEIGIFVVLIYVKYFFK